MGRPAKYTSPEELQARVDEYFASLLGDDGAYNKAPTMASLARALGYVSRQSLYDAEKVGDDFSYIIKRARLDIEACWEQKLAYGQCTGAIFWLKNHAGYTDKMAQEITGKDGAPVGFRFVSPDATTSEEV